jgi:iron complex transport system substrate-binding protein
VYAIGAGELLAGVVRGSDFPAEAAVLPQMGDSAGLDFERIVHAQADAVLVWGSGNRRIDIERLRALGQHVVLLEPRRLSDIPRHLRLLGALTGREEATNTVVRQFENRLAALQERHAHGRGLRVLFEIWHRPLLTVNGDHIISKVLELCGAQNIFAGLPRLAGEVSLEQVLLSDPDAIVIGSEAADAGVANWLAFPYLKAVRAGHVFTVAADEITRQTPRLLDAAEKLCRDLEQVRK